MCGVRLPCGPWTLLCFHRFQSFRKRVGNFRRRRLRQRLKLVFLAPVLEHFAPHLGHNSCNVGQCIPRLRSMQPACYMDLLEKVAAYGPETLGRQVLWHILEGCFHPKVAFLSNHRRLVGIPAPSGRQHFTHAECESFRPFAVCGAYGVVCRVAYQLPGSACSETASLTLHLRSFVGFGSAQQLDNELFPFRPHRFGRHGARQ
mmetsp:Transcript_22284/g.53448  ORF Transcript_22284/g.53448 Transcript_22284/m.53448 type:complete len:203 (+) Transcript_22284:2794-3402(+)